MSYPGITVMLHALGMDGNKTALIVKDAIGKTITSVKIDKDKNELQFHFTDGTSIRLFDDGQSCCEYRYMHTDDKLDYYTDSVFQSAEVRDGPEEEDEESGEVEESQFLIITTDKGQFTIVNYNEHNGYYGGFAIVARELEVE